MNPETTETTMALEDLRDLLADPELDLAPIREAVEAIAPPEHLETLKSFLDSIGTLAATRRNQAQERTHG
ncbi:MAG: hypothetical protein AAF766_18490 [Cyanobacteria bacterium P01_D01_bin.14]